jgi:hypothetical protein
MKAKKSDDQFDAAETARRGDALLFQLLKTPPRPPRRTQSQAAQAETESGQGCQPEASQDGLKSTDSRPPKRAAIFAAGTAHRPTWGVRTPPSAAQVPPLSALLYRYGRGGISACSGSKDLKADAVF